MNSRHKKTGFTLTEMLVVVGVIAILLGISIPASKKLLESFDSSAGSKALINAALSNARAIAVREQKYAGIRFQQDINGDFYMIFIIHDPDQAPNGTGLANGFRAVESKKPMKLPGNVGVLDGSANSDITLHDIMGIYGAQTFSIVFSPAGRVVHHAVRIRNAHGAGDPDNSSIDLTFNVQANVEQLPNPVGMFYQDDYPDLPPNGLGLGEELSAHSIYIYEKEIFKKYSSGNTLFSQYIQYLPKEIVNPHTGELVVR